MKRSLLLKVTILILDCKGSERKDFEMFRGREDRRLEARRQEAGDQKPVVQ